jgi:Tol biopolymer transport system component
VPPTLTWVDRAGREEPVGAPPAGWVYPRISPDGRYVVADVFGKNRNIQVWDLQRRNMIPLTDGPTEDLMPVWSGDGRAVCFGSSRGGTVDVFAVPSDGSGAARLISGTDLWEAPQALASGDAKLLISVQRESFDVQLVEPAHPDRATPLLVTRYNEMNPSPSPDGRWFAYQSDDSGKDEIYVRPFEDPQRRRWKVSIDGGTTPLWSRQSDEIFFRNPTGDMMAAAYVTEPEFDIKHTVMLFAGAGYFAGGARAYDVAADGRFLMVKKGTQPEESTDRIVVVVNWSEALKKLLPEAR